MDKATLGLKSAGGDFGDMKKYGAGMGDYSKKLPGGMPDYDKAKKAAGGMGGLTDFEKAKKAAKSPLINAGDFAKGKFI